MRILSRPLDMRKPLWEMTIVTGLRNDRVVIVNRAHHAMVDGVSAVDIITLLVDTTPESYIPEPPEEKWKPRPAPTRWQLIKPVLWNVGPRSKDDRSMVPAV